MNGTWPELNYNITTEKPFIDRVFSNTSLAHRLLERFSNGLSNDEIDSVSAWWLVFIVVEFVILTISGHQERFALNDSITSICAGILSQCFKFGGRTVAIFLYVFIWNNFRVIELPWDSPYTWILCLFFQDLMYYFGHRAVHEAGFFWGLHTIHHSSEYYNLSTALRQAAIQDAGLAIYDVLQAFFIPPTIFLVHRYFSEILQFIMHTSLVGNLGPLGIVFNTPSHHRVHHGRNPYCIDKNYGGVFIIWDKRNFLNDIGFSKYLLFFMSDILPTSLARMMFGTFEAERLDDPPVYGLVHNENTFNQIYLQVHVLWDMLYFKGQMKNEKGEPLFPGIVNKVANNIFFMNSEV
ncbi:fatty acid hydroxylase family protein [Dictyocaulus viviparus]|uniref:Fatty acid hydroxylase family protein n=1 Tax=Dictyocaulus viviparus TaxID=29172 RepID=A0A0D8XD35_DICVI|nr:fatty acid hydroxylase family protein [Dictyocaulus viviparus]